MPVGPTPFGHIGLFPEQAATGDGFISEPVMEASRSNSERVRKTESSLVPYGTSSRLKSFWLHRCLEHGDAFRRIGRYHVDATKPNVQSCRSAAELNGWQSAPFDI